MKKHVVAIMVAGALAGCAGLTSVLSVIDQIQQGAKQLCGYEFTLNTIDAIIKALGGPPVISTIEELLCTQARTLVASQAPKATGAVAPTGQSVISLGTVLINNKPVPIQILR